ncbi:hypothetical protein TcasGA2_TC031482 [Tribolium castaneum]|uniref:Uncharacterized protein n=1 Tax=Tribolium castaneum TaxID=7070 RepID=A0A139WNI8_TRICA|nr:hypothetical protein TcasGA2_TC031482 [Tribolium castaneum]
MKGPGPAGLALWSDAMMRPSNRNQNQNQHNTTHRVGSTHVLTDQKSSRV